MKELYYKTCLVGLGPAGIGFLWHLRDTTQNNDVVCFEAGSRIEGRTCPVLNSNNCVNKYPCNIISGFGGSSLMAGGKLSRFPAGTGLIELGFEREYLNEVFTTAEQIYLQYIKLKELTLSEQELKYATNYYQNKGFFFKHYDSSLYTQEEFYNAHVAMQNELIASKIRIEFNSVVEDIAKENDYFLIVVRKGKEKYQVRAERLVLGVGKFGSSFLRKWKEQLEFDGKINKLEIGVRIEFPMEAYPDIDRYHHDLKLKTDHCKTFCVSKGGKVALYVKDGLLYTEGYDNYNSQTNYSNLGFMYSINPDEHDVINIQEEIKRKRQCENQVKPIRQAYSDFMREVQTDEFSFPSSIICWQPGNIVSFLPEKIKTNFKRDLSHFISSFIPEQYWNQISIFFPESNYGDYCYQLDTSFSVMPMLHIIGESTGRFIGILQSFASGLICSKSLFK